MTKAQVSVTPGSVLVHQLPVSPDAVCRQEEQTTLKRVVQFLGLGEPTHEELTAMGHMKANRGHPANSQYPG